MNPYYQTDMKTHKNRKDRLYHKIWYCLFLTFNKTIYSNKIIRMSCSTQPWLQKSWILPEHFANTQIAGRIKLSFPNLQSWA